MRKIKILFVCHGNICRSTMAESVMTYLVEKEGLADKFYINSAATSREEIGNGVHHGTVAKLKKEGIPVIPHTWLTGRLRMSIRLDANPAHRIVLTVRHSAILSSMVRRSSRCSRKGFSSSSL